MADGEIWRIRWPVQESGVIPEGSLSVLGGWDCCDNPDHPTQTGWFILTPVPGCTWAELINEFIRQDIRVVQATHIPHYLPEELRRTMEE